MRVGRAWLIKWWLGRRFRGSFGEGDGRGKDFRKR